MTMNPRDNRNQMALQSRDQSEPDGMAVQQPGMIKFTPLPTFLLDQEDQYKSLYLIEYRNVERS